MVLALTIITTIDKQDIVPQLYGDLGGDCLKFPVVVGIACLKQYPILFRETLKLADLGLLPGMPVF